MIISTRAIVLKTIQYGDSSIICRLFTKDHGKVVIIAKGAWRPKNNAGPILEPMNHIDVQYYNKNNRDIQILKNVTLANQFSLLRTHLTRIVLGQIIVESLDKVTLVNNPAPILYRLAWRVLEKMDQPNVNYWMIFSFYLYHLSVRLGFMPNLDMCSKCQSVLEKACIDNITGELICKDCSTLNKISLNYKSLVFLQKLRIMHLDEIENENAISKEMLSTLNFLKVFNCIHLVGMNKVRSLDMIQKILT